jgi:steroid delta-isomerase-like uncharacterized protein
MKKLLCIFPLVLLFCFTIACRDKAAMAELEKYKVQANVEEQNKDLYRKMVEAWNRGDYEYRKGGEAPEYVYYYPSGNPKSMSREETIEMIKGIREGFPDSIWTLEELVAVGDTVIARNIFRGTHKGNFQGVPTTGNRIDISSIIIARIKNGKVVEEREDYDSLGMMQQLGMELKPIAAKKK